MPTTMCCATENREPPVYRLIPAVWYAMSRMLNCSGVGSRSQNFRPECSLMYGPRGASRHLTFSPLGIVVLIILGGEPELGIRVLLLCDLRESLQHPKRELLGLRVLRVDLVDC